jgi:hypothetical protein
MPLSKSKKQVSPYKYSCNDLFKILAKYQCIKLLQSVASSYKIPNEVVLKESENIIKQIDDLTVNITYKKRKEYTKKNINTNDLNNRCCGRVYSVNNLVSLDEVNDKLVYGSRCVRKITSSDTIYCKQHNMSLTHGNFLEEPNTYIKNHFIVDYIKCMKRIKENVENELTQRVLSEHKSL